MNRRWSFWIAVIVILPASVYLYYHPQYFDFILKPSRRTVLYRNFTEDQQLIFDARLDKSLSSNVLLQEQYAESIYLDSGAFSYAGYKIDIAQGENLNATISSTDLKKSLVLELYDSDGMLLKDGTLEEQLELEYDNSKNQTLTVVVQTLDSMPKKVQLKIFKEAEYAFPLPGKTNTSIKSFWGAARDGGSRKHEGNDIFAKRDYPIVAVTNGHISSVRNRGLGGKQIWLSDSKNKQSVYYAHLNGWNVEQGDPVREGDTIGFVGNTGNAKNTPPHLHLGIYKNGAAIDPRSFIWKQEPPADYQELSYSKYASSIGFSANLRTGPSTTYDIIRDMKNEQVSILGNTSDWYHVRTSEGITGFMHKSTLEIVK